MARPRIRVLNTTPYARLAGRWLAARLDMDSDGEKTLRFGFDIVFSWLAGMAMTGAVSAILGSLAQGMAAVLAGFVLRVFSAGSHCRTSGRCALVTSIVYGAIGKGAAAAGGSLPHGAIPAAYGLSVACLFLRAKPRDPRDVRNIRFRPAAVLLISVYAAASVALMRGSETFASLAVAIAFACLWQSFTITEAGAILMNGVDRLLEVLGVD